MSEHDEQRTNDGSGMPAFSAAQSLFDSHLAIHRTTLVVGRPDAGKTVFALQSLMSGAQVGEPGVFLSFDSERSELCAKAQVFGWDLDGMQQKRSVTVVSHLPPVMMRQGKLDFPSTLRLLQRVGEGIKARRVFLDGFHVPLLLAENREQQVEIIFALRQWLFESQLTGIITADLERGSPPIASQAAYLQFMADCAVRLDFRPAGDHVQRYLRLLKYRGALMDGKELPFSLSTVGIQLNVPAQSRAAEGLPGSPEIQRIRGQLASRIQCLDAFIEMKQAELDFLLEQPSQMPPQSGSSQATARPSL